MFISSTDTGEIKSKIRWADGKAVKHELDMQVRLKCFFFYNGWEISGENLN